MSPPATPDRIEKKVLLHAPLARAWEAISDAAQFGTWFGVAFEGPFAAGARVKARIVPTQVDAEVAKSQEPCAGTPFEVTVERIEPERLFSFRWHPHAVDPGVDTSAEPTTLVEFVLQEAPGGTLLAITESGFDGIPLERRATAFSANEGGWEAQTRLVAKFLVQQARP